MRKLRFDYATTIEFAEPVSDHRFQLRCLPPNLPQQRICDLEFTLAPNCPKAHGIDSFYNPVVTGRIEEPHESFSYHVGGLAFVDQSLSRRQVYKPLYRYQSDFTQQGPALEALTAEMRRELARHSWATAPLEQARYVMGAVHERLSYVPGATNVRTVAEEALAGGAGVCQDYAQVAISVCRGLGLMAKYVAGLYDAEGATHAWFEVYQGGNWHPLDPTNNKVVDDSYIKISHGRDYGDCMLSIGVFRGAAGQTQTVHAKVEALAEAEQ
ncbi:transglutaminase domain-containing protein [Olsenella uli]|uniref:transglutaminase family protein n=1 Tax=Olsenella uli TaxID=133926 RepID=UPI0012AC20AC|nr:transglutaminase family protein [Olsenella uli]